MRTRTRIRLFGTFVVNQIGQNYPHFHHSTVLGSILSAVHSILKTPSYPRVDMFKFAADLGVSMALFANRRMCVMTPQYVTHSKDSNTKQLNPTIELRFSTDMVVYVWSSSDAVNLALSTKMLKFGKGGGTMLKMEVSQLDVGDIDFSIDDHDELNCDLIKPSLEASAITSCPKYGNVGEQEICLVSQIENTYDKQDAKTGGMAIGLYSDFSYSGIYDQDGVVNYRTLYNDAKIKEIVQRGLFK